MGLGGRLARAGGELSHRITVRPLERGELTANIDGFVDVARDVAGEYWSAEHFLRELPDKWVLSLAVWEGESPVGYAIISRKSTATAHLHHFMVSATQRGKGLGAKLLDAAMSRCRKQGFADLTLKVARGSADAHRFYRRHGFDNVSIDGDYQVMRRKLTTTVAIHQPNYAPWLGYFAKMASANVFVFLNDVQYSKNGYINRVQIDARGIAKWLTVPVSYDFGNSIDCVQVADSQWRRAHLDTLKTHYGDAPAFAEIFSWLCDIYGRLPQDNLADLNRGLIQALAGRLELACSFRLASKFKTADLSGDDRLIAIAKAIDPAVIYLSGKGGASYQNHEKFARAGLRLTYSEFTHPVYDQGHESFIAGLSVLDALFRVGFERTSRLIAQVAVSE